jgi:F0F1-type ATP synthase assembly protein I
MTNAILGWIFGIAVILGLPLGCIVAVESGSPLSGLGSLITVLLIGFLVCRKEILREYMNARKQNSRNINHICTERRQ